MTDTRENNLLLWLLSILHKSDLKLQALNGDASFRKYYRVDGKIAVNSPPDSQKNHEFIDINARLKQAGINVPCIYATNLDAGFFLLEDLGSTSFADFIKESDITLSYKKAIDMALQITKVNSQGLPLFDKDFILFELNICRQWCFDKAFNLKLSYNDKTMLDKVFSKLVDNCLAQKQIAMHRDFHCRNIMVLASGEYASIDYQDMVKGPVLYDLASLLFDCYIKLDLPLLDELMHYAYRQYTKAGLIDCDYNEYVYKLRLTAMQRHVKVLGIFYRLYLRDGKDGYLKDLPRVLSYILDVCKDYSEFKDFGNFLLKNIKL